MDTKTIYISTYICIYVPETHLRTNDTHRLKVKGRKKIFYAHGKGKKAGVRILISDKMDSKQKLSQETEKDTT